MAKPLTQKQLKAMQKKAQAALENTKKTLASVEETQFTETKKSAPSSGSIASCCYRKWRYWCCLN
jgi:hypothetical protein